MTVSNPAGLVTSRTGGAAIHSNRTVAPPPTGSTDAPEPSSRPSLSGPATLFLGSSSPTLDISSDTTTRYTPAASSTSPRQPPSTTGTGGPQSNSFSTWNQSLQQYPPSSIPAAAATSAAASLLQVNTRPSPSLPPGAGSVPPLAPDARTLATYFTTHDFRTVPSSSTRQSILAPGTLPTPPSSSATRTASPFLPPFGFPSGGLHLLTSLSPTSDEHSPPAPTPPPKSPGIFSVPFTPSERSASGSFPSVFMGGSQSKPAAATSKPPTPRPPRPGQRLHKSNPQQQAQHTPPPTSSSTLSPGGTTARGRVSRSPSPVPTPSSAPSTLQSQSQLAPAASRPYPASSYIASPPISASGSTNSASSKLKRAFAARRKQSGDASTSLSMLGKSSHAASTASLVQKPKGVVECETATPSRSVNQKQLATPLLGQSACAQTSSGTLDKAPSRTFGGAPVLVPSQDEMIYGSPVEGAETTSLLSPLETVEASSAPAPATNVNRESIIKLSPRIASAVDYMRDIVVEEERKRRGHVGVDADIEASKEDQDDQKTGAGDGRKTDEGPGKVESVRSRGQSPFSSMAVTAASSSGLSSSQPSAPQKEEQEREQKESWRKSDSTIGHHTIRVAGVGGNSTRTSRPVSMTESFQSAYTVVPTGGGGPGSTNGSKRWSTVTGDLDFEVMMEEAAEEEEEGKMANMPAASVSQPLKADDIKATTLPSAKNMNRRSLSLNVGISSSAKPLITPAHVNMGAISHRTTDSAETRPISYSISEGQSGSVRAPTTGATGASHAHSASDSRVLLHQTYHASQAQGPHIQSQQYRQQPQSSPLPLNSPPGRVPAWTVTPPSASPFSPTPSSLNPNLPPPTMANGSYPSTAPVSFRQTAISMSNGFAKRAAEKIGGIGKKWGLSTSSSGSGYSSSSSSRDHGAQPSSYSSSQSHLEHGLRLGRTNSNQSSLASSMKSGASLSSGITSSIVHHVHLPGRDKSKDRGDKKKKRRTPDAPSGAYSVASSVTSASTSESDGFPTYGPVLGRVVRGPLKNLGGGAGLVFGRDLRTVVSQTRAVVVSEEKGLSNLQDRDRQKLVKDLEHRMLPALVLRCAQHILIWGIQEEGLFRVSGRASHISKLRSEFNMGADYDLTDCAPGDLDPHAVASVFKAYLRELPESILTNRLHRLFESALAKEVTSYNMIPPNNATTPGLPKGPKGSFNTGIRKAPSLSTLAMPSFNGVPPASHTLICTLRALISQLPFQHRDLVQTVVELIRETAAASKDTKMPLSNLMLVFCPSLNMSPPLLKALCEAEGIWESFPDEVIDIKRQSVLDISVAHDESDRDDDDYSDARDGLDCERQSMQSIDQPPSEHPSSEYNASAENSLFEERPASRRRDISQRPMVPTLYLDSHSHYSSSSLSSAPDEIRPLSKRDTMVLSPPLLNSSSSEFLATPVSSGHPSLSLLSIPPFKEDKLVKKVSSRDVLKISETLTDRNKSRQPTITIPLIINPASVQFPAGPPTPKKRRSIPMLSLPNFSPISPSATLEPPSPSAIPGLRGKKPSLRRLFTKRSTASIGSSSSNSKHRTSIFATDGSPDLSPLRSASDSSSVSTPLSAVTAPQSSTWNLPPVLDTAIEGSSLSFALGLDISPSETTDQVHSSIPSTGNTDKTFYASAQSSANLDAEEQGGHAFYRPRFSSTSSAASSNHLGLLDDDGEEKEDWTRSVLIAVGAERD